MSNGQRQDFMAADQIRYVQITYDDSPGINFCSAK